MHTYIRHTCLPIHPQVNKLLHTLPTPPPSTSYAPSQVSWFRSKVHTEVRLEPHWAGGRLDRPVMNQDASWIILGLEQKDSLLQRAYNWSNDLHWSTGETIIQSKARRTKGIRDVWKNLEDKTLNIIREESKNEIAKQTKCYFHHIFFQVWPRKQLCKITPLTSIHFTGSWNRHWCIPLYYQYIHPHLWCW